MLIYTRGSAVIEHGETSEVFEICEDELDWEPIGGHKRGMGPETIYQALIDHNELGELRWTMSEYPVGAEGPKTTDVGKHKLVEDFEFGLEHEPEYEKEDNSYGALRDILKANPIRTGRTNKSRMVEMLVEWFRQYYEDPANETPYNGREGGYLYFYGGPYSAEYELCENFEDIVQEEAITEAVDIIQEDGTWEWAPSSRHPAKIAFYEEAMAEQDQQEELDFDDLREMASERAPSGIGTDEERSMRADILLQISAARSEMPRSPSHGGMGHNHPPEEFELHGQELENAAQSLEAIETELANDVPDVEVVAEQTSFLKTALGWAAGKLDTTIDEFCKGFGKTLGVAAGRAAIALPAVILGTAYWGKIAAVFGSLKGWLLLLLV